MPSQQSNLPLAKASWNPADRIMEESPRYLSDAELLEVVLRPHLSADRALAASRRLLETAGGLHAIADMSPTELVSAAGLDRRAACAVVGSLALGSRARSQAPRPGMRLTSPASVALHFRDQFNGLKQEGFHVLLLDAKLRLIRDVPVTVGLVDRSQVHAREVFRPAIREASSQITLVHNHPSGDPTPSAQDIACTSSLVQAGKIIGIEILDHVVIGTPSPDRPLGYVSFREERLLK